MRPRVMPGRQGVPWVHARRLAVLVAAAILISFPVTGSAVEDRGRKDFWIEKYGEVREGALVLRARTVFARVLDAADKRDDVLPSLHVIRSLDRPLAQTLADGSVLLAEKALSLCYGGKPSARGDARLAFVLGHELAHLKNGDFWEYRFLAAAHASGDASLAFDEVERVAGGSEQRLAKELRADQYGILYAVLAGYDSDIVLSGDKTFFLEWAERESPGGPLSGQFREGIRKREKVVDVRLREIADRVPLFKMGLVSARLGRTTEAATLFARFAETFPSREVYGNLGTVRLAVAYDGILAETEGGREFPFRLSFGLDPRTRAELVDVAAAKSEGRSDALLTSAEENFGKALSHDPTYIPARNGMACVHILRKRYFDAVGMLEEALKRSPGDARVKNNLGVASLLLGRAVGSDPLRARGERLLNEAKGTDEAARENLRALTLMEGDTAPDDAAGSLEEGEDDGKDLSSLVPPQGLPRLRPGASFHPERDGFLPVEKKLEPGGLACYRDAKGRMFVLVKGGKIRMVLYRIPSGESGGAPALPRGGVVVSRKDRKGVIAAGGRPTELFEF